MKKTIFKNIVCSVLFVALIIGSLSVASFVAVPKSNSKEAGMKDATARGIISEPQNTIDAVFVGDSEVYRSIMPLKIFEDYGITSYVCSTPAQKLFYSQELLEKTFEKQNPKYIFIETNCFFRDFTVSQLIENYAENVFPILRYHTNIKIVLKSILKNGFNFDQIFARTDYSSEINDKGYRLSLKVRGRKSKRDHMAFSKEREPIPDSNIKYIKKINEYCKSNGAELIFLSIPSTQNYNYNKHNSIADLAEQLGVKYVDMNLAQKEVKVDWKKDTYDKGDHMNYYGAQKVSAYLGKYLFETDSFQDKRNDPAFSSWNNAVKNFYVELEEAKQRRKKIRENKRLRKLQQLLEAEDAD